MSGIEEAYSKYAKGLVEHKLNLALDRLDEHGAVIANLNKAMVGLQHQIDCMRGDLMGKVDQCEEDEEENDEETRSDIEFIKEQLYENHQLLERIDKYIRL